MRAFFLLPALLLAATTAHGAQRGARCVVASDETPTFRGPCLFISERGGSFSISPSHGQFSEGVDEISVTIISPGVAEVRGLTADGINSRWGRAARSRRDRACWIGSDFSICVY